MLSWNMGAAWQGASLIRAVKSRRVTAAGNDDRRLCPAGASRPGDFK